MALKNDGVTVTHTTERVVTLEQVKAAMKAANDALESLPLDATREQVLEVAKKAERAAYLANAYASQTK